MNKRNRQSSRTAGVIRYSCGILFLLFSFCYLFFLQGELLAEAQFVFSRGVTTYNLLAGAIIIPLVLLFLQWLVGIVSQLPPRFHALSYLPSMLLLAMITDVNKTTLVHFGIGAWAWIFPLALVGYILLTLLLRALDSRRYEPVGDIRTQLYPNFIILLALTLMVGSIPKTTDVYHFELKAERLILEKDYEAASRVGERSLRTSARLTQLRMYALSKQGLLAERIFDYPQHDGSKGLLDVTDTLPDYRFSPQAICLHLGAFSGNSVHSTQRFFDLVLADDTLWNQQTVDYYLCSLLLDKRLSDFKKQLPRYYHHSDTVQQVFSQLPKAYREALMLTASSSVVSQGKVPYDADTLSVDDAELLQRFMDYNKEKAAYSDLTERMNLTHRHFGNTYWWYYDYSQLAQGELK